MITVEACAITWANYRDHGFFMITVEARAAVPPRGFRDRCCSLIVEVWGAGYSEQQAAAVRSTMITEHSRRDRRLSLGSPTGLSLITESKPLVSGSTGPRALTRDEAGFCCCVLVLG